MTLARSPDSGPETDALASIPQRPSILFACRDNSGLSLLAEAIVNQTHSQIRAFSAGIQGSGDVDSALVDCLELEGIPADGLSSKPMELFGFTGAPRIDLVISLVADAREKIDRLAGVARLPLETWTLGSGALQDPSDVADPRLRRHLYRLLVPRLREGIAAFVASRAVEPACAA
ncbi:low molecular weight phosphatase family protein [Xanthobacteraceae bacterium A53D]